MNFDKLFNQVFLTEADNYIPTHDDESDAGTHDDGDHVETAADHPEGTPVPDNYNVEPAPVGSPAGDAGSLKEQIRKLDDFAEALNGVDSGSLQQLVNDMDRPGSLFQGISRETSPEIIRIAGQVAELSEIIKGFVINSAKRSRDIAAGAAAGNQR
jgi:hypothetical protein